MARLKLREFQEYLGTRLASAARGEASSALLGIQSGKQNCLLKLAEAGEIMPLTTLTPVPLTHHWFAGMANIRGNLYSVVDFSAFRGEEPTPRTTQARLVLVGARFGVNCAILVNRMLGLRPTESFSRSAKQSEHTWVNHIVTDNTGQDWHQINVPTLLADQKFMQIGL